MTASEREYFATPSPLLGEGAVRALREFPGALRNRVYNLIEDHVRKTRDPKVNEEIVIECIMQAMREMTEEREHVVSHTER